jgi:hypothetical protein
MQERCRYAKPMMLKRIDLVDGRGKGAGLLANVFPGHHSTM